MGSVGRDAPPPELPFGPPLLGPVGTEPGDAVVGRAVAEGRGLLVPPTVGRGVDVGAAVADG